ncbi:MAG: TldD/PmbA family protein [Gammaproteobacteria bacterium]|nr:TldD/PmbA family protein [Gammaproteobacteria bacterium]MDH4253218.1 TldD/PmbA family protein [Gammaproteobacteria bacterium]MDH5309003.1 TldD/PmbA family protein [Gammaproteobacteria bacterium]
MSWSRRHFLRRAAAGGVSLIAMPTFLAGCGVQAARTVSAPTVADPFFAWFGVDERDIARILSRLTVNGADSADLYFQHRRQTLLRMDLGEVRPGGAEITQGLGLRVAGSDGSGFSSTEDLSMDGMLAAADEAASAIRVGSPASPSVLVRGEEGGLYRTSVPWVEIGFDRKLPVLSLADRLARQSDPAIDNVTVSWSDTDERVLLATADGRLIRDYRPMTRLSIQVSATRNGVTHSGFANMAARAGLDWYSDARVAELVDVAVQRTMLLFEARMPPAGEFPVILAAGTGGVLLHEAIGHTLEADFVDRGDSIYANRIGERIAEAPINLVDQGTLAGERGALNYDDEGNACRRNLLVENGVLRSYLHDAASARRAGVEPTGSGRRQTYRHQPMPRMTCTFIDNGTHERDELVAAVDRGILVETFTGGNVQLGSGDYDFVVRNGWLIEGGRLRMPLRDIRLAGNGPATLAGIRMVANDFRMDPGGWTCGKNGQRVPVSQGMPSVLVDRISVQPLA